ncbi:unnamed protein product [Boreogadus saida]
MFIRFAAGQSEFVGIKGPAVADENPQALFPPEAPARPVARPPEHGICPPTLTIRPPTAKSRHAPGERHKQEVAELLGPRRKDRGADKERAPREQLTPLFQEFPAYCTYSCSLATKPPSPTVDPSPGRTAREKEEETRARHSTRKDNADQSREKPSVPASLGPPDAPTPRLFPPNLPIRQLVSGTTVFGPPVLGNPSVDELRVLVGTRGVRRERRVEM